MLAGRRAVYYGVLESGRQEQAETFEHGIKLKASKILSVILEHATTVHEGSQIFIWERSWARMRYTITLRIRETVKRLFRPAQGIFNYQRQDRNANVAKA